MGGKQCLVTHVDAAAQTDKERQTADGDRWPVLTDVFLSVVYRTLHV